MTTTAGVHDTRQAKAIQFTIEVTRRYRLLLRRHRGQSADRAIEKIGVRLRVNDGAAVVGEFIRRARRRLHSRGQP